MIKVVHIASSVNGGAGIAAFRLHESLMQSDFVDSSIVQGRALNTQQGQNKIYRCTHYHPLSYRIKNKLGLLPYSSKIEHYKKIFEEQPKDYEFVSIPYSYFPLHEHPIVKEADVINLHWTADFLDVPSFFTHIKQPIVWTLHDANPFLGVFHYKGDMFRNKNEKIKNVDQQIYRDKLKNIHLKDNIHIVTPSRWLQQQSMESDIFSKYPHSVIANPFDYHQYPKLDRNYCKIILDKKDKVNILFIAEDVHNYRKGMDLLIQALNSVSPDSFNLMSVGSGSAESLLSTKINYISFGSIKNKEILNLVYSTADVTIIPSREDNLPNVMFESMLNGTPVISFNNGGMAEHIRTGKNGIIVNEITSEALAKAINDFINNKYQFDNNSIRQYPMDNLNYEKQSQAYISLYKSILNQ